jgi:N6-L-threonylcarbamoyladenine synthase
MEDLDHGIAQTKLGLSRITPHGGLYCAKACPMRHNIPMVAINHLEGHILSIFLEESAPSFPFVALTVSGGHTSLYHVKGYGQYTQMGQTLDDAAGEAFDKVAKILGLGYPGGAAIERHARGPDRSD